MIRHFFKLGLRNLYKQKGNTLVNLFGLSLGIAILLVISIFSNNELNVDSFHGEVSNIFKVSYGNSSGTPGPLEALLETNFPEIQRACHIETHQLLALSPILEYKDDIIDISAYYAANEDFFDVFDFKVVRGDIQKAMQTPFAMVLTKTEAERIFRQEDPIGQTIIWRSDQDFTFTVEAIVMDAPQNSSIQFNGLISEASSKKMTPFYPENWSFGVYETYLLLNPEIETESLEEKLRNFLIDYYETTLSASTFRDEASNSPLTLHSLREVYFNQDLGNDSTSRGNMLLVRVLQTIGLVILLLSVINYVNLSTSKSTLRKKEIGVQKVYGSGKKLLVLQHLTEASILSFMAAIIGLVTAVSLLPWFSQFMDLSQNLRIPRSFLLLMLPCTLLLGIIAGIYPSFYISSVKEMSILSGGSEKPGKKINLRQILVIFQFFVAMVLIAVTFLIDKQVSYLKNRDLGIDKTHVVFTRLPRVLFRGNKDVFTERIRKLPAVEDVTYSSTVFGEIDGYNYLELDETTIDLTTIWVDAEFMEFYDLELVKGRFFSDELRSDMNATALLNEAAVRALDVEDPYEIEIRVPGGSARVVGIVKDFNFKSLHHEIEPLAIIYLPRQGSYANMKISGSNIPGTLDEISRIWAELAPGFPFNYHFLDARFDDLYQSDEKMGKAITLASVIAIIIAVMGVMSLSLFLCQRRVKEIALRKINGAKAWEVILELNRSVAFSLVVAFILSWPASWYIMTKWLDNFAYRTKINKWIYIVSASLVSLITFSIVSWQSWKFANRNPADTIRYE